MWGRAIGGGLLGITPAGEKGDVLQGGLSWGNAQGFLKSRTCKNDGQ
jgi:hypothetical protein